MSKRQILGYSADEPSALDITTVDNKSIFGNIRIKTNGNLTMDVKGNLVASTTVAKGNLIVDRDMSVTGAATLSSTLGVSGITSVTNATQSSSSSNGALVV